MWQLVYVSVARTFFTEASLRDLLVKARTNNTALDISGMLLHQAGSFMQILEGDEAKVESLYAKIDKDPRHERVVLLKRSNINQRNFADWSMGFVDVRGTAKHLPGFRKVGDLAGLIGDAAAIESVVASFCDGRWRQQAA